MKLSFFALIGLVFPVITWCQTEADMLEAAKLGLIEKMYDSGGESFRANLANRGYSDDEVESILFDALDTYAACYVLAAQTQAREQGLSEEIILKGIGGKTRGKDEAQVLIALDTDAMKEKQAPCRKFLGEKLGIVVR
ncbi:MAG: hypothetical protein ACE5OQ_03290 [Woeseia sp.]